MDSTTVAIVAVLVVVVVLARRREEGDEVRVVRLHLVDDARGNECLLLDARLDGVGRTLFLLDTAYAGAPVLSRSYLATAVPPSLPHASVRARYRAADDALSTPRTEDEMHAAVGRLLARGRCRTFTSGCTMRLMSIGETREAQSDMLLCRSLAFDGGRPAVHPDADVFVTHELRGSVHILTMDYLLHRAPVVVDVGRGRLVLRAPASAARGFEMHPAHLVGGAFRVTVQVEGVALDVVVDSGAAAPLSVGHTVARRHGWCRTSAGRRVQQVGVNGERVCSDVLRKPVAIGSLALGDVDVLVNSSDVEGADGYVGMGLLRALDLFVAPDRIGFRPSGLPCKPLPDTAAGTCDNVPTC